MCHLMSTNSGVAVEDEVLRMDALPCAEGVDVEALHPGRVIDGRYRLIEKLGEGGMGVVFLAEHIPLGRRVALKTLKVGRGTDLRHQKRLEREARVGSSVQHENVARILDAGHLDSGRPYFVLEWVDGIELSRLIAQKGALRVDQGVELMIQVARGVAAAHAQGVSHRDLKPHNVMVLGPENGKPRVKVLDFGLSKWDDDRAGADANMSLTDTGFIGGTPQYMAPEMIRGECSGSRAADVYAMGAIFYELLGGGRLHEGASPNAILYSVLSKTPTPIAQRVPGLPAPVANLVQRAISKEPQRRPDAHAFVAELEQFVAHSIPSPRSLPNGPRTGRSSLPFAARSILAAVTALGCVFVLGVFVGVRAPAVVPQWSSTVDPSEGRMGTRPDAALAETGSSHFRAASALSTSNEAPTTAASDGEVTSPLENSLELEQLPRARSLLPVRSVDAAPAASSAGKPSVPKMFRPASPAGQSVAASPAPIPHQELQVASDPSLTTASAAQDDRPLAGFVTENPYD